MENENLYPNNGQPWAIAPKEQQEAKKKETENTISQLPLLKEVIKHFDAQIEYLDSIDSISPDLKDPQATVNQIAANKLSKAKLQAERSFILARIEKAARR